MRKEVINCDFCGKEYEDFGHQRIEFTLIDSCEFSRNTQTFDVCPNCADKIDLMILKKQIRIALKDGE